MPNDLFYDNAVTPLTPPAPYLGGKTNLADRIVNRIQAIPHTTYAEPFLGMGGVFFRRTRRPKAEIINDVNKDLVMFFRVVKRHYEAFLTEFEFLHTSRAEFDRLKSIDPDTMTDIERAARFYYLQCVTFGGKPGSRSFGLQKAGPSRFNPATVRKRLAGFSDRLAQVTIENLPWDDFMGRIDTPRTLFYLDPPYLGGERDYGKDIFARADFERIASALAGIKGQFILSINDVPEIRETFASFQIEAVKTTYSVAAGDRTEAAELLITNVA